MPVENKKEPLGVYYVRSTQLGVHGSTRPEKNTTRTTHNQESTYIHIIHIGTYQSDIYIH